jgi:hypothetical protein
MKHSNTKTIKDEIEINFTTYKFKAIVEYTEDSDDGDYETPPMYDLIIDDVELEWAQFYHEELDQWFTVTDSQAIESIKDCIAENFEPNN